MSLSLRIVAYRRSARQAGCYIFNYPRSRGTRGMLREPPRGLQNGIISSSWQGRGSSWSPEISSSFRFLPNIRVKIDSLNVYKHK